MENEQEKPGIVLNRMYVGDYLSSNLGHEVINLYQADNERHYIYLNATGDLEKKHQKQIKYMLFVKYYGIAELEVIGKACELEDVYQACHKNSEHYDGINPILAQQKEFADKQGGITYGGVSIFDIFNDAEQQNVFITYKAQKVYTPKKEKRLFIRFRCDDNDKCKYPKHDANDIVIELEGYQQAKTSLKQYIYAEGDAQKQKDYNSILTMLIDCKDLWDESKNPINQDKLKDVCLHKESLFDICKIQNDENSFSNALAYFMLRPEYHDLWNEFFKEFDIELGDKYTITREESTVIPDSKPKGTKRKKRAKSTNGGRIDLLIRTENDKSENDLVKNYLIVIENKIKSDINSVESDGDGKQLCRYYKYVKWLTTNEKSPDKGKKGAFIILTPNYNVPDINDKEMQTVYKVITYNDLYKFLSDHKNVFDNDANFTAFYDAMFRHTHNNVNDYLYYEMQEKFFRRIIYYQNQRDTK